MRTALIARYWPSHPDGVTGFEALDWLAPTLFRAVTVKL